MKKILTSSFAIFVILLMVIACSKDRSIALEDIKPVIDTVKTIKDYTFDKGQVEKVMDKLASKSEVKTIKSINDLPFYAKNGTKIWVTADDLYFPNGTKATYPFDLEVLELLTPQDMILHDKPTVSNGALLTTGGELYIKATKNNQELNINNYYNNAVIQMPSQNIVSDMALFNGSISPTGFINWQIDNKERPQQGIPQNRILIMQDSSRNNPKDSIAKKNYVIFPTSLGWINVDKFYQYTGVKTKLTLSSAYPALENIQIFLFFPNIKSIMRVYGNVSGEIPVGETLKIISVAVTTDEKIFLFTKDVTITDGEIIDIKLVPTTQQELNSYLQGLHF